jgi:alkanesulfonate monooxygenase SsuD/methylene tetrahydromethanopterin reductase-like flavin-dependent oxidoreductase (luciferase family)
MKFGLDLRNFGDGFSDPRLVAEIAYEAESAGWDGVFIWDHVNRPTGAQLFADPVVTLTAAKVSATFPVSRRA